MPNNYVPVPTPLGATVPEMVDGEPRTAASVTQITRPTINAVANLELGNVADQLADFAALRAINTTSMVTGERRVVANKPGVYIFDSVSSVTEQEPWIIDPTTGPGRWVHELAFAHAHLDRQVFTGAGTTAFTTPNEPIGAVVYTFEGCGAGGGGGGGCAGDNGTGLSGGGGGGGGGAEWRSTTVSLLPATTYEVVRPAGGAGGNGSALGSGANGIDGGDTILRVQGGAEVMRFRGAGGGLGGALQQGVNSRTVAPGGLTTVNYDRHTTAFDSGIANEISFETCAGAGGAGYSTMSGHSGCPSPFADGGAGGAYGSDSGGYLAGGGGGGGGGGYYEVGLTSIGGGGGNGGNANSGGAGSIGANGTTGTGAGCGGGGGGGGGSGTSRGPGGNGAAGSAGMGILTRAKSLPSPA